MATRDTLHMPIGPLLIFITTLSRRAWNRSATACSSWRDDASRPAGLPATGGGGARASARREPVTRRRRAARSDRIGRGRRRRQGRSPSKGRPTGLPRLPAAHERNLRPPFTAPDAACDCPVARRESTRRSRSRFPPPLSCWAKYSKQDD